ncbi:hypothetical protein [Burkholderia gladioli]|uniref:hypothetical protein n=1 Tax=Burkholderia gladioli TaxID=28095 RepID=UPI001FC87E2E|nr:hypothetical protein [Burkholderia gladioli]
MKPAGGLTFSRQDQLVQAAVDGHGIAIGGRPLVDGLIRQGRLVELFGESTVSSGRYVLVNDGEATGRAAGLAARQDLAARHAVPRPGRSADDRRGRHAETAQRAPRRAASLASCRRRAASGMGGAGHAQFAFTSDGSI